MMSPPFCHKPLITSICLDLGMRRRVGVGPVQAADLGCAAGVGCVSGRAAGKRTLPLPDGK